MLFVIDVLFVMFVGWLKEVGLGEFVIVDVMVSVNYVKCYILGVWFVVCV